jgi:hypothetical protein
MEPAKQPEALRQEYRERQRQLELDFEKRRKTLVARWTWAASGLGLIAALVNYLGYSPACYLHLLFCGTMAYVLLCYRRGHLTGILTFGIGNITISFIYLHFYPSGPLGFNPFGLVAFCLVGGVIGMGMRLEHDHDH